MKAAEYTSIVHATSSGLVWAAAASSSQRTSSGGGGMPRSRASTRAIRWPMSVSRNIGTSSRNWRSRSSAQTRRTSSTSNGPRRAAIASAVRPTTSRSPDAGTGTRVLPKSRVIAVIPGARAGSAVKPRPRPAAWSARSRRRPGSGRRGAIAARGARPRRRSCRCPRTGRARGHPAGSTPRRSARAAAPASGSGSPSAPSTRRDDRHPPHVGRQLAACRLLGPDEPRREVRDPVDGLALERPGVALRVPQDRVVLARPPVARPPAVVVGPDDLVEEALRPEHLVEEQPGVVDGPPVDVEVEGPVGRQHAVHLDQPAWSASRCASSGRSSAQAMSDTTS